MQIIRDIQDRINELITSGYFVKIEQYISTGFSIFKRKPELFLLYTAFFLICMPFGGFILSYPLTAGFFIAAHRIRSGKTIYFEHFFDGFKDFVQLTFLMIVQGIIVFIGFLFFIIPGIYFLVAYYFAPFFIIFEKMNFREAMETSRRLIQKEWFAIFGLIIILALINFLGIIAFGVGILFTLPITLCALYAAFDDIVGVNDFNS